MSVDTEQLRFREKLGYGLGDAASNLFFQVFLLFLLYYYTDVYGLAPAAVGTMFLVTKVIDAISDPAMGLIADRTRSRWGKFRPYLLWAAIPYGVFGYAMFYSPDLSATGKLIYAYLSYSLMMLAYTAINVPYSALMGVISPSSVERTKVATYRFVCAFSAGWLVATFVTPLKNMLGAGSEVAGFRRTMMIFAVMSVVLFWVSFATTKERVHAPEAKPDIRADLRALLANGPWLALFFAAIFNYTNFAMRSGAAVFWFKYYAGDDGAPIFLIFDKTAVFLSLTKFALIGGVLLTQPLSRRFDKRSLMIALTLGYAVAVCAFYVIPPDQYWSMVIVGAASALLLGPTIVLMWSMYADAADYGEWKTGRRTTALVFSAAMFGAKMGLAVGAGLAGYILSLFGFIANEPQTETSIVGIKLLFSVFPAATAALAALSIYFYAINDNKMMKIERDLADRR